MYTTSRRLKIEYFVLMITLLAISFQACNSGKKNTDKQTETTESETVKTETVPENKDAISVVTQLMDFQMKDTIRSGWQTFYYHNKSNEPHFFLLEKYPEGKTIEDARTEVIPVFQRGMNSINQNNMDQAMEEFGQLPDWYQNVAFVGGTGLIAPGKVAISTIQLEPGYYVMECYVKKQGVFHSAMGMVKELIVDDQATTFSPPEANVEVHISSSEGITYSQPITKGLNVFAVTFDDQKLHEHFVGHDVHLVRLEQNYNQDELLKWMNWAVPGGLESPGPEHITFLGGVNDMPGGSTAYFTAELYPGKYAFISEVPEAVAKNMFQVFEVGQ